MDDDSLTVRLRLNMLRRQSTAKKGYAKSFYDGASSYGGDVTVRKNPSKTKEDKFLSRNHPKPLIHEMSQVSTEQLQLEEEISDLRLAKKKEELQKKAKEKERIDEMMKKRLSLLAKTGAK